MWCSVFHCRRSHDLFWILCHSSAIIQIVFCIPPPPSTITNIKRIVIVLIRHFIISRVFFHITTRVPGSSVPGARLNKPHGPVAGIVNFQNVIVCKNRTLWTIEIHLCGKKAGFSRQVFIVPGARFTVAWQKKKTSSYSMRCRT